MKRALLWLMALFYMVAGVLHFVFPEPYLKIMPPYLPWHLALVYLSGVAEVGLGALLLWPATRRLAAIGVILLLIAIFPANLHMALHHVQLPGLPPASPFALWMRLPLQLVLIAWAAWYIPRERPPR